MPKHEGGVRDKLEGNLTPQQALFVKAYAKTENGTQAAKAAGYRNPSVTAVKLLKKPSIARAVKKVLNKAQKAHQLAITEIITHLYYATTRTSDDFVDPKTGQLLPLHKLSTRAKACIEGIEQETWTDDEGNERVKTKIRLMSKVASLDMAMKHKGLFAPQQHDLTVKAVNWDHLMEESEKHNKRLLYRIQNPTLPALPEDDAVDAEYTVKELMDGEGSDDFDEANLEET